MGYKSLQPGTKFNAKLKVIELHRLSKTTSLEINRRKREVA